MVCNADVWSFLTRALKSSFCFTDVEIIAVAATGFVNYFRFLRTIQAVLVWKERFDAAIILKNYLEVNRGDRAPRLVSVLCLEHC